MYQSSSPTLLVEKTEGVLRFKLNRPEKQNLLQYETMIAAMELVDRAAGDWSVRVVVFEGEGDVFLRRRRSSGYGSLA